MSFSISLTPGRPDGHMTGVTGETAMKPDQCRAARALVHLSRSDLGRIANVHRNAIQLFENGQVVPKPETITKLRAAFLTMSIRFIEDDDGIGVRRGLSVDEIAGSDAYLDVPAERTTPDRIDPVTGQITPEQARAARAFLGISQAEAARQAGVGLSLLIAFETGTRIPRAGNTIKIREMYEALGVTFMEINGQPAVQAGLPERMKAA